MVKFKLFVGRITFNIGDTISANLCFVSRTGDTDSNPTRVNQAPAMVTSTIPSLHMHTVQLIGGNTRVLPLNGLWINSLLPFH